MGKYGKNVDNETEALIDRAIRNTKHGSSWKMATIELAKEVIEKRKERDEIKDSYRKERENEAQKMQKFEQLTNEEKINNLFDGNSANLCINELYEMAKKFESTRFENDIEKNYLKGNENPDIAKQNLLHLIRNIYDRHTDSIPMIDHVLTNCDPRDSVKSIERLGKAMRSLENKQ